MKRIFLTLILVASLCIPSLSSAQSKVVLKGNASLVSDDNKLWGLEINGTVVVEKNYLNFSTPDGKSFVVTARSGKKGICNAAGVFIYSCNYDYASITGTTIYLKENRDAKPQFFSTTNPKVAIQPKQISVGQIEDEMEGKAPAGTYFNPQRIKQRRATAQALVDSDRTGVLGSYQIRDTPGGKQELVMNDQVLFTATTFQNLFSAGSWAECNNSWYFIVMDRINGRDTYGVYYAGKRIEDGKIKTEGELAIPYNYGYISQLARYKVKCDKLGSASSETFTLGKPTPVAPKKVHHVDYAFKLFTEKGYEYAVIGIKSVELHDGYTELKMSYTTPNGGGVRIGEIDPSNSYQLRIGDKVYKITSWGGGFECGMNINGGQTVDFDMRFEPLPEGATGFVLLTSNKDAYARRLVKFE